MGVVAFGLFGSTLAVKKSMKNICTSHGTRGERKRKKCNQINVHPFCDSSVDEQILIIFCFNMGEFLPVIKYTFFSEEAVQ